MKTSKNKNKGPEGNSKKQTAGGIFILILVAGYFIFNKMTGNTPLDDLEVAPHNKIIKSFDTEVEPIQYPDESPYSETGETKEKRPKIGVMKQNGEENSTIVTDEITNKVEERKREQEALRNNFQNLIEANLHLPGNLHYAELDLDEGIAGLRGTGTGDIKDFSILGTRKKVTAQMATSFLNEADSGIPTAKGVRFLSKSKVEVKAPAGKGIGKIDIIDSNNPSVKAALVTRADGKGTYLFVLRGQPGFFDNNEGFLDNMLQNFQAK